MTRRASRRVWILRTKWRPQTPSPIFRRSRRCQGHGKVAIVGYCWAAISPISQPTRWAGSLAPSAITAEGSPMCPGEAENPNLAAFQRGRSADPLRGGRPIPGFPADVSAFSYPGTGHGFNCANAAVTMRRRLQKLLSAPCSGSVNMWKVSLQSC